MMILDRLIHNLRYDSYSPIAKVIQIAHDIAVEATAKNRGQDRLHVVYTIQGWRSSINNFRISCTDPIFLVNLNRGSKDIDNLLYQISRMKPPEKRLEVILTKSKAPTRKK